MSNIVIPGIKAQAVETGVSRSFGTAGTIAIVGNFQKGDANIPYFFSNPNDALNIMGSSPSYSGSNIINYAFKQDLDNNNYGASDCVCVRAGATAKATYQVMGAAAAQSLLLTADSGGIWANGATNGLTVTIATGTLSGLKLVVMLNSVILNSYDNCVTARDMMNKINADSTCPITASGTTAQLVVLPVVVVAASFTGGTETATPTTDDLTAALATISIEDFDILIFTDTPINTYLPTIKAYLDTKFALAKGSIGMFALAEATAVPATLTTVGSTNSDLMAYKYQQYIINGYTLTEAETVARYASFVAGLPVNQSPTNKIISDVDGLNTLYNFGPTDTGYPLVDNGITMDKLLNRKNQQYGIVSAVTAIHDVDSTGQKVITSELYVARIRNFALNYFNLDSWLGGVGLETSIEGALGELENRSGDLISQGVLDDAIVTMTPDPMNNQQAYANIQLIIPGILKSIIIRVSLTGGP